MQINKQSLVHVVLGHSYLVYFASLILGLLIDTVWSVRFHAPYLSYIGFVLLFGGPLIIVWAQQTSHRLAVKQITQHIHTQTDDFHRGPYRFTRSPTHWGLFLMIIGLGLILNSVSIVETTMIAFVLTRIFFLSKEESLLAEKYGVDYKDYKSKVTL